MSNFILNFFCIFEYALTWSKNVAKYSQNNAAVEWQFEIQDSATPIHEGLVNLYDDVMFILVLICFSVVTFLAITVFYFKQDLTGTKTNIRYYKLSYNVSLEFIWTVIPTLILLILVIPTFSLIFSLDDFINIHINVKIIGHQWYWTYDYGQVINLKNSTSDSLSTINQFRFDSYIVGTDILEIGRLRLLEVEQRLVVPFAAHVRLLITSTDVLHSWAVPSIAVKIDACPGRLNQVVLFVSRPGIFYGQCSEICGVNHAFIPICVEAA